MALYQLNIVFGILVAFIFYSLIAKKHRCRSLAMDDRNRSITCFNLYYYGIYYTQKPKMTNFEKNDEVDARKVFSAIYPPQEVEAQVALVQDTIEHEDKKNRFSRLSTSFRCSCFWNFFL